jgi:hypothetical protein
MSVYTFGVKGKTNYLTWYHNQILRKPLSLYDEAFNALKVKYAPSTDMMECKEIRYRKHLVPFTLRKDSEGERLHGKSLVVKEMDDKEVDILFRMEMLAEASTLLTMYLGKITYIANRPSDIKNLCEIDNEDVRVILRHDLPEGSIWKLDALTDKEVKDFKEEKSIVKLVADVEAAILTQSLLWR